MAFPLGVQNDVEIRMSHLEIPPEEAVLTGHSS
jgi:hypothetical protein